MRTLKNFEIDFRRWRRRVIRAALSGKRGRRFLANALPAEVTAVTLDRQDHVISFNPHELIGRSIFIQGDFDRKTVLKVFNTLEINGLVPKDGLKIVEIGANIGTQTVYFHLTGKVAKILAIEPDPVNLKLLRRNIEENHIGAKVVVVDCAIGEAERPAVLYRTAENHGDSSLSPQGRDSGSVKVEVRPLPAVLAESGMSPSDVDFIWMDIQGAEPLACASMTALMERQVPMFSEFSPVFYGESETKAFIKLLSSFYERCILFDQGKTTEMAVSDLPCSGTFYDVLLLPSPSRLPLAR